MGGLGSLTSLTGGGGMSASSSATATNGDFGADSSYRVGNMTFGAQNNNHQLMIMGGFALIALMLWKK